MEIAFFLAAIGLATALFGLLLAIPRGRDLVALRSLLRLQLRLVEELRPGVVTVKGYIRGSSAPFSISGESRVARVESRNIRLLSLGKTTTLGTYRRILPPDALVTIWAMASREAIAAGEGADYRSAPMGYVLRDVPGKGVVILSGEVPAVRRHLTVRLLQVASLIPVGIAVLWMAAELVRVGLSPSP